MSSDVFAYDEPRPRRALSELADISVRRGDRLRRRRRLIQAAPVAAVVAIAIALGPSVLTSQKTRQDLHTVNRPDTGAPAPAPAETGSNSVVVGDPGVAPGSAQPTPAPLRTPVTAEPMPSRSAIGVPGARPAPASGPDECVVNGRFAPAGGGGVAGGPAPPVGASVGSGGSETCDYNATDAGGYATSGNSGAWEIDVTHPNGSTDSYGSTIRYQESPCQAVGVVKPGDHVHVSVADSVNGQSTYVKVGPSYHC